MWWDWGLVAGRGAGFSTFGVGDEVFEAVEIRDYVSFCEDDFEFIL